MRTISIALVLTLLAGPALAGSPFYNGGFLQGYLDSAERRERMELRRRHLELEQRLHERESRARRLEQKLRQLEHQERMRQMRNIQRGCVQTGIDC